MMFRRDWGMVNIGLSIARSTGTDPDWGFTSNDNSTDETVQGFVASGMVNFDFSEKFQAGLLGYFYWADEDRAIDPVARVYEDLSDFGIYAKWQFHPYAALRGVYYIQNASVTPRTADILNPRDDDGNAWKVFLKLEQDLLRFTDLQLEYGEIDNNFVLWNEPYSFGGNSLLQAARARDAYNGTTTKLYGVKAAQQWNDKWDTWIRYYHADFDIWRLQPGFSDDVDDFGIGVGYQLNPAVHFELAYDKIDYGRANGPGTFEVDDHLIQFQTSVSF
jgi:hypothetical protein